MVPLKSVTPNFVASFVVFGIAFSFMGIYFFLRNICKTRGSHFEISHQAIIISRRVIIYYLLTESEVITGKSQTEALMY